MNIMHYSLGYAPIRTGGMNRYATDLILEQSYTHKVALLYPSGYKWWHRKCHIEREGERERVSLYRLINSHPVPLLYGIKTPSDCVGRQISKKSFELFYNEFKPDVLHIHTLMGMPEEVLAFFKEKGVKIIFTSHDYFGICPKVNLINQKGDLCEGPSVERCALCNAKAPSTLFLRLRNSSVLFLLRDFLRWIMDIKNS